MKGKKVLICFLVAILVLSFVACNKEQHYHYFEEASNTPATCTTAGEIVERCSCGEERTTEIQPLGHEYEEISTTATCTESGIRTIKCQRCDDTYDESIEALGHSYAFDGYCTICDEFKYDIELSNSIPITLNYGYSSGTIITSIELTEVKFRIGKESSYGSSYLYMVYSGEKIYDTYGTTHIGSVSFVCILKDRETGEIVASTDEWISTLVVGEKVTNRLTRLVYESKLSRDKKYVLELFDRRS